MTNPAITTITSPTDTASATAVPPTAPLLSRRALYAVILLWGTVITIGFMAICLLTNSERERDEGQWQRQMQLATEASRRQVEQWVAAQQSVMTGLADNVSLKLYLAELLDANASGAGDSDDAESLSTFLRNLLVGESQRYGFSTAQPEPIGANLPATIGAGLGILNIEGALVTSTVGLPSIDTLPANIQSGFQQKSPSPIGPFLLDGKPYLLFYTPVRSVQSNEDSPPIGYVIGLRQMDQSLASLLKPPVQAVATTETVLIQPDGEKVRYLSRLQDGTEPLALTLSQGDVNLAAMDVIGHPGHFSHAQDYRGNKVLVTGQPIAGTNWFLMHKVDEKVAMAESRRRIQWLMSSYWLLVGLITVILLAVWRQASASRAKQAAQHYKRLAYTIDRQQKLLKLITRRTPNGISIVDTEKHYRYANEAAAFGLDMTSEEMIGKRLQGVLPPSRSHVYEQNIDLATQHQAIQSIAQEFDEDGQHHVLQALFVPLAEIPLPDSDKVIPGTLIVERDLTDYSRAQKKYQHTLSQLVQTLVMLVDSRDPNAQYHSECVATIAEAVAVDMQLKPVEAETAELAGRLMNVGKIKAAEGLLTEKSLSEAQKKDIRQAMHASADILKDIPFNGPVVETLKQAHEHVDGSGSLGLKEDEILTTAKIIGIANAYVAMISPRAYRDALSMNEALETLRKSVDSIYSRPVFVALEHYLINGGGAQALTDIRKQRA